jgi:actin-like ATPase involved in cell morphogenesis
MAYSLGVDLGTTYTAAAIQRGDRLEIADLGTRSSMIPSVVYLREDGTVLTGEAAIRRGVTDPSRLSREFKRRMGDTTAILLGGVPYSVDGLMARMLQAVLATVTERQGEAPAAITLAHPANWGQYKKDLLEQAIRRADLDGVTTITEPEAAAVHYAMQATLESGSIVAVYDLGGGTFDAAVLRKTATGFELIGEPEGIERLGGIDFDEAVFRHVVTSLRGALAELDPDDPVAQAAVSRLRDECVSAKEALSADTEVSIPVILPNVQTEVRLTRAEFEAMIRPALADTLVVLNRAIRSAGVTAEQLHSVLLVGGSSRIPLIAQLVSAELGRPIALDVHPKHSVALGAAAFAAGAVTRAVPASPATAVPTVAMPVAPAAPAAPVAPVSAFPLVPDAPPAAPPGAPPTAPGAASVLPPPPNTPPAGVPPTISPVVAYAAPVKVEPGTGNDKRRGLAIAAAALVVAALVAIGFVVLTGGDDPSVAETPTGADVGQTTANTPTASSTRITEATDPATTEPATTEPATTAAPTTTIHAPCKGIAEPCIVIDSVSFTADNTAVLIRWTARGFEPDINDLHAHFYWSNYEAFQAGSNAPAGQGVPWEISDQPTHVGEEELLLTNRPVDALGVCATVGAALADPAHSALNPKIFDCLPLPKEN